MASCSESRPIAALAGSDGPALQALLHEAARRIGARARVVGVIEVEEDPVRQTPGHLLDLASGARHGLFQDLGKEAGACSLDPAGPAQACGAVLAAMAQGCDLVVLNKFGKLEAEMRAGLTDAFAQAMAQDIPVLTAISTRFAEQWQAFAAPLYTILPPDLAAIEAWWESRTLGA